jgi:hypothetical protein
VRRHFGPAPEAPRCCTECGERLVEIEHPNPALLRRALLAVRLSRPAGIQEDKSMSSTITTDILPGLGPVCPECFFRGRIAALRLSSETGVA